MSAFEFIIILGIGVAVGEIAYIFVLRRSRRRYEQITRIEKTRQHFAEIRTDAVRMMIKGDLKPNAQPFEMLYGVSTFIMRRPDCLHDIADMLFHVLVKTPPSSPGGEKAWSPASFELTRRLADGIELLLCDRYWFLRLARVEGQRHAVLQRVFQAATRADQRRRERATIENARDRLLRISRGPTLRSGSSTTAFS